MIQESKYSTIWRNRFFFLAHFCVLHEYSTFVHKCTQKKACNIESLSLLQEHLDHFIFIFYLSLNRFLVARLALRELGQLLVQHAPELKIQKFSCIYIRQLLDTQVLL
jgi:hypothetical protein